MTLRNLRRAQHLSQEELADLARLNQKQISDMERGRRRGRPGTWRRLAAALGVPVEWFGPSAASEEPS